MLNIIVIDGDGYRADMIEYMLTSMVECNIKMCTTKVGGLKAININYNKNQLDLILICPYVPVYWRHADVAYCIESMHLEMERLGINVPICVYGANADVVPKNYYTYKLNFTEDEEELRNQLLPILNEIRNKDNA